jgi:hypothetical protein
MRCDSNWERSLAVLAMTRKWQAHYCVVNISGMMLGLGESRAQLLDSKVRLLAGTGRASKSTLSIEQAAKSPPHLARSNPCTQPAVSIQITGFHSLQTSPRRGAAGRARNRNRPRTGPRKSATAARVQIRIWS